MNPFALVDRIVGAIASRWRNLWFRLLGVQFGGYVWLRRVSIPRQWSSIRLEAGASLDEGVALVCDGPPGPGKLTVGERTYINRYTILMAADRVVVGKGCMIGAHCYITDTDHGTRSGIPITEQPLVSAPVTIGNDVWIGSGVVVLKGVTIGDGAVVGAGAVVTHNVAAGTTVAGVPARPLKIDTRAAAVDRIPRT